MSRDWKDGKVDGILSGMIDELSLSFRRMDVKLTKEVTALTKKVQTLEKSRGKDLEHNQGSAQNIGALAIRTAEGKKSHDLTVKELLDKNAILEERLKNLKREPTRTKRSSMRESFSFVS